MDNGHVPGRARGAGTSSALVADASALGEYVLGTTSGRVLAGWIEEPETLLHAPSHVDLEVSSFLRGVERARLASRKRVSESLGLFLALPLELHEPRPLVPRAWALGRNLCSHDAAYVALAEAIDAPLLTLDGALARAVARHTTVTVIGL